MHNQILSNLGSRNLWDYVKFMFPQWLKFNKSIGLLTLTLILVQVLSGFILALNFIPEPALLNSPEESLGLENYFFNDFLYLHKRGVDLIYFFLSIYILQSLYISIFRFRDKYAWKNCIILFLVLVLVTIFGLLISHNTKGDFILAIIINTEASGDLAEIAQKPYFSLSLPPSAETLLDYTYAHYITAFFFFALGSVHFLELKLGYLSDAMQSSISSNIMGQLSVYPKFSFVYLLFFCILCYSFFYDWSFILWGDIAYNYTTIASVSNFSWYFSTVVGWLLVLSLYNCGFFSLFATITIIYLQPNIVALFTKNKPKVKSAHACNLSLTKPNFFYNFFFLIFCWCIFYCAAYLILVELVGYIAKPSEPMCAWLYVCTYLTTGIFRQTNLAEYLYLYFRLALVLIKTHLNK